MTKFERSPKLQIRTKRRSLVARMIGTSTQEDKQMLRQAQIAKYINLLYEDAFQDWCKKRHDQLLDIARHALALQRFRTERMPPGATTLETFADFRDQAGPGPIQSTLQAELRPCAKINSEYSWERECNSTRGEAGVSRDQVHPFDLGWDSVWYSKRSGQLIRFRFV